MIDNKMSFEESMQRLELIVRALERGDAKLEESLRLFQEGTELIRHCGTLLENAELEVRKVMVAADGTPVLEDFTDDAGI
jgi:exodeoxyribonuclease VII small subunit